MGLVGTYGVAVEWGARPGPTDFVIGVSTIGGTDTIGPSGFDDLTADGRPLAVEIDREVSRQGTCRVTVHDPRGAYNPANPSAAHAPNVTPMRRVRVTLDLAAAGPAWGVPRLLGGIPARFHLFNGYVARIRHDPDPRARQTVVEAVDGLEVLDLARPVVAAMGATTTGAAVRAVVLACGVADTDTDLDTGVAISGFSADGTRSGLDRVRELVAVEQGQFFVAADGRFTFRSRQSLLATVQGAVWLDSADFGGLVAEVDKQDIINQQKVTRTGGVPQTSSDLDSQKRYFQRPGADVESALFVDDAAALALANYVVLTRSSPTVRVRTVTLPGLTADQVAFQAGVDLGARVSLDEPRGGTRSGGYVRRVQHRITREGHTSAVEVERLPFASFTIGVSAIGGTDRIGF